MAQITITAPDAWVTAIGPDIVARAAGIYEHTFCQKVLTAWGKTFEELTNPEKIQLFCFHAMWSERARARSEEARNEASSQATIDALNEF